MTLNARETTDFAPNCNLVMRGAWAEMLVAADLLRRGYEVFLALGASSCDMIVLRSGRMLRVEVKLGHWEDGYTKFVTQHFSEERRTKFDLLAEVSPNGAEIRYKPDLDLPAGGA